MCSHIKAGMIYARNYTLVRIAIHSADCCQPGGAGSREQWLPRAQLHCRGQQHRGDNSKTAAGPVKLLRLNRKLLMLNSLGAFAAAKLTLRTASAKLFQAISMAEDNLCQQKIFTSIFSSIFIFFIFLIC